MFISVHQIITETAPVLKCVCECECVCGCAGERERGRELGGMSRRD